jgi:hypothetical protein
MTCKACGRDVPLEDKNCFDCNEEGPYTRADRLTPWNRRFAWLPVRLTGGGSAWLRTIEERVIYFFGPEYQVRLAPVDTLQKGQDAEERLGAEQG